MSSISLNASVRSALSSLKTTAKDLTTTTDRLSTGKKVASAIDNPTNYFAAQNYNQRADALSGRLDSMGEATEMINAADNGITTVKSFLSQMSGIVNNALSNTDSDQRREYGKQFNELITQIRDAAKDSSYGGINLIYGNASQTVQFGQNIDDSNLKLQGFNISAASGEVDSNGEVGSSGVTGGSATSYALSIDLNASDVVGIKSAFTQKSGSADKWELDWGGTGYQTDLTSLVSGIEKVSTTLQTQSSKLANNLAIITQRETYTNNTIDILNNGANDLTLADLNEEGANLLSLQTSQSLAVQALSLSSSSAANVLSIIR
jgi:flagellin-like hook-associated protein FlgL